MIIVEGKIKGKAINGYKILKHWIDKDGYHTVSLRKNRKSKQFRVHRLVAEMFIPNIDKLPQVNHIDGNKDNNTVTNLEWISLIENIRHACNIGIYKKGEGKINSKLTNEQVKWIRENYRKGSRKLGARPLARRFGVTKTCIYYVVNNMTYKEVV